MAASSLSQSPVPAPTSKAKDLLDLNNETLSSVVRSLDAPGAVCLALTCKHMKTLVTSVCSRDLGSIVPKYAYSDEGTPPVLQFYSSTKEVNHLFWGVELAIHTCIDLGIASAVAGKKQYSRERIGLLSQLSRTSRMYGSHLLEGHDQCTSPRGLDCRICSLLSLMQTAYRSGRSDMLKELEESGEVTYDEDGDDTPDAGEDDDEDSDSDDSDGGGPNDDQDDGDQDGESEIDDGLNDPDSFSIHTESERSADEDDDPDDGANDGDAGSDAVMSNADSAIECDVSRVEQTDADVTQDLHEGNFDGDEDDAVEEAGSGDLESALSSRFKDGDELSDSDEGRSDDTDNDLSDENDDSDLDSEGSDDKSEGDDPAPIQKLSNELLTKIVLQLDPPTAVCFGLSCKQFYKLLPVVSKTTFSKICPRFADESSESPLLPQYCPTPSEIMLQRYAITAIKLLDAVRDYNDSKPKCLLSTDYVALMSRLSGSDLLFNPYNINPCSVYQGHTSDSPGALNDCGVCTVVQLMQGFRVFGNHGTEEGPSDYQFNYIEDRAGIARPLARMQIKRRRCTSMDAGTPPLTVTLG